MCPLWPAHYLLMYILMVAPLWFLSFRVVEAAAKAASNWDVQFQPSIVSMNVGEMQQVHMIFDKSRSIFQENETIIIEYEIDDTEIADIWPNNSTFYFNQTDLKEDNFSYPSFNLTGKFLGYANVQAKSKNKNGETIMTEELKIAVSRVSGPLDKAFTYSVAALVAIIYINMGAALDEKIVLETLKRPFGPAIGFTSQFLLMPLLAYGIAKLLIQVPALQLGLFITGCSPGGGASNIWTLTLKGNLDLSITLTTISTFSAFFMMPLWLFTLGKTITDEANLTIPYSKILTFAITIIIPLTIGIFIRRKLPKIANFLVKILKPFAVFLIVFIIVFAIYTNLYLFKIFTWTILLSGLLLPWLGFILGGGMAILCKQNWKDVVAISIETGVQNTGLAIFALRFSLPQPEADLTTALPVAVAIMTPILPTCLVLYQRLRNSKCFAKEKKHILVGVPECSEIPDVIILNEESQTKQQNGIIYSKVAES